MSRLCTECKALGPRTDTAKGPLCSNCYGPYVEGLEARAKDMDRIDTLRKGEGDSVNILCDNHEGTSDNAIECCGSWTNWDVRRFEGTTISDCLVGAVDTKAAVEAGTWTWGKVWGES